MIQDLQRRTSLLIMAIAIGIILVCILIPHSHSGGADGLAILLFLYVGFVSSLCLLAPLVNEYTGCVPEAPTPPSLFLRPPSLQLA